MHTPRSESANQNRADKLNMRAAAALMKVDNAKGRAAMFPPSLWSLRCDTQSFSVTSVKKENNIF